jgi:hypothetical protein
MTHECEPIEEISKEELDQAFKDAINAAEQLHRQLASAAEKVGYSRDVLVAVFPAYQSLYELSENDPTLYPIIASGIEYVRSLTGEFNRLAGFTGEVNNTLVLVTNTSGSFAGSTGAVISIGGIHEIPAFASLPKALPRRSSQEYVTRLNTLDHSLAKSYEQVWQIYYGTSADRHRASLFMMRQVYDHFFSLLAPDDLVRCSKYWQSKQGEKPDQIFRSERVAYAANNHIKNEGVAETLAASAKQINNLYEAANEAHNRGTLNEDNANKAILAMDSTLKDWLDAIQ